MIVLFHDFIDLLTMLFKKIQKWQLIAYSWKNNWKFFTAVSFTFSLYFLSKRCLLHANNGYVLLCELSSNCV